MNLRGSIVVSACVLLALRAPGGAGPAAPGAPAPAAPEPHPSSCKPRPPVVASIARGAGDVWQVRIEAHEDAGSVQVRAGTGAVDETGGVHVWAGALGAGEIRTFEVAVPAGEERAWVAAEVTSGAGAVRRSVAVSVPAPAAISLGRVLADPSTGEAVYEFPGHVDGAP